MIIKHLPKPIAMKHINFLLLALAFSILSYAQVPFKVITVNGEIIATKANVTLENGIEVLSDDNFDFRRPNSRAAMINSERGRVVLTEKNATDAFSRAAFAPAMSTVSARSGAVSSLAELQSIFSDKLLVIDKIEVQVGSDYFPMEDERFFFIRYEYNDETINKKLSFNNDVLIIDKEELFKVDGKSIEDVQTKEVSLYYHKRTDEKPESILINTFEPLFVTSNDLKPEVEIIVDELKGQPADRVLAEVYDYLTSFYGKVDRTHLEAWLNKEFDVCVK